jgi:hypothetical protein
VYGRILEHEGLVEEGGKWTVLKLPAEDPPDSGKFLWSDYYGRAYYEDFKKDDEVWFSKFQQDPQGQGSIWFKKDWLRFYDVAPHAGRFKTYLLCDPGATKDRKSDRTSIQVWAAGQNQELFLVDWVLDKLDPIERQSTLERLIRKHNPEINLYEEYGLVNDSVYFNKAAEETGFDAILTPVGKKGPRHNLAKHDRIKELKSWFIKGQIILPRRFEYQMSNGQKIDLTKRFIDEEYDLYCGAGSVAHEDDFDCMSRINDLMPPYGPGFDWYIPQTEARVMPTRGYSGTWESVW